jgi:hypothetical protein
MKSKLKLALCAMLGVLAVAAATSTAALAATNDPLYETEAGALKSGEALEVTAQQDGTQLLGYSGESLNIQKLHFKSGAKLLGSASGLPGTSEETIAFEDVTIGLAKCEINKPSHTIETQPLKTKLVYLTKAAAEKEEATASALLVQPATGTLVASFTEAGEGCAGGGGEERLTAEPSSGWLFPTKPKAENAFALTQEVEAPSASVKVYYAYEENPTTKKVELYSRSLTGMKIDGVAATYSGRFSITAAEKWRVG